MKRLMPAAMACAAVLALGASSTAVGSSHREAPNITKVPKVDATDFYMFRSYEAGRSAYVTMLANYQPLQAPYGGPNYFSLEPRASYNINIDSDGDAVADTIFRFRFQNYYRDIEIPVNGVNVAVPLNNVGPFTRSTSSNLNLIEAYTVDIIRDGRVIPGINKLTGNNVFVKPHDNIGNKSIADYETYARQYITPIGMGPCEGRVFVGQRKDGFAVNLGEVFDLVNTDPIGPPDGERNLLDGSNVTTIALEMPAQCIRQSSGQPIVGAWTTARLESPSGVMVQVSRLGAPLVNEVVIGLPDKDRFNTSFPENDSQFAQYVTNPTLPELLQALFGVTAPNSFPRNDLVAAFLTGLQGLNQPPGVTPSEMLRLNTSILPKPAAAQSNLGALTGDIAGFPNGRRPGDDVVDIALRVAMGVLLTDAEAPDRSLPYTDGATVNAADFDSTFPYLKSPLAGSPSN